MTETIAQQVLQFFSKLKVLFLYSLSYIIFGTVVIYLYIWWGADSWLSSMKQVSQVVQFRSVVVNIFIFLVFAYILGLLLHAIARVIFSKLLRKVYNLILQIPQELCPYESGCNLSQVTQSNDIDILTYLGGRELVKDIYLMQLFYSLVARLLFGLVLLITIIFGQVRPVLILGIIMIVITWHFNVVSDNEVNNLGNQIKGVMGRDKK